MLKNDRGMIISATKDELRDLYAERGWSEVMNLDEFFSHIQMLGIKIEREPVNIETNLDHLQKQSPLDVALFITKTVPQMSELNKHKNPDVSVRAWENWLQQPYTQFFHETLYTMVQSNCRNDGPEQTFNILAQEETIPLNTFGGIRFDPNMDPVIRDVLKSHINKRVGKLNIGDRVKLKITEPQLVKFFEDNGYHHTDAIKWAVVIAESAYLEVIGSELMTYRDEDTIITSVITSDGFMFGFPEEYLQGGCL